MAQYIDKDTLVVEIENLENTYKKCPTRNAYEEGLKNGRLIGYEDALHKIDALEVKEMKEEPVSEDLEEVAEAYALDDYIKPWRELVKGAFKAGANWKDKQMMEKAIDGYVIEDIEEGNGDFLLSADYLPKSMNLKDRQKVKVIVIKED